MWDHQVRSYLPPVTTDDRTTEHTHGRPAADHTRIPQYEIRVRGHLDRRWTAWLDGLSLATEDDGTTVLRGPVADQAALHGLLQRLRDVGIPLVALTELPADTSTTGPTAHDAEGTRP